jgi:AAA family ATP:ADP antiporter
MKRLLEFKNFTAAEKLFIIFSMGTGFLISAEYAITRPASSSLFLATFGSHTIPIVWLVSVPFNLFLVYLYNRYLPKIGPLKMIGIIGLTVVSLHFVCALCFRTIPQLIFIQFLVKDIYILLMYKQLWSMIHSTISSVRAKYLYGVIFGMGTLGSILGSFIPSFFAVELSSERLFFFTAPLYAFLLFCYWQAFQRSSLDQKSFSENLTLDPRPSEGFSLIRRSPFLIVVLCLVVFMQVSVGLMDYQFNSYLEKFVSDPDLRTEYCGKVVGITNMLSGILQFFGGFVMVHFFGLKGSHLFVPFLLLGNACITSLIPSFGIISFSYIFIKSVDFSLFGVIREMLYVPLKLDEKFRAKAVIDVFVYRSSKALVAICILALQWTVGSELLALTSQISIAVFIAWIALVFFMLRRHAPIMQN